jgi:putative membrane protein
MIDVHVHPAVVAHVHPAVDVHVHPAVVVWAAAAAVLYVGGVRAVAGHRTRPWPAGRTAAFLAGVAVALAALASPLAARAEDSLSAHMWQHLLLTFAAAPLVVLGAPLSLALRALRGGARARLAGIVRSRGARALAHPATTWTTFTGAIAATHLSGLYDLALRNGAVHAAEHALYLGAGLLFWLPVLGANPVPQVRSWLGRTAYLILALPPMSAVAAALVYAEAPRYPTYAEAATARGVSALADQQEAGAIMAVGASAVLVTAAFVRTWQALLDEERRQRVLDTLELRT